MSKTIPNPETQINVAKRYLHVLALLQNNKDPFDWNASSLADLLSLEDENDIISDKTVRDYIQKYLIEELDLDIEKNQGCKRTGLAKPLDASIIERIAMVYSSFVVSDTSREVVLKRLIEKHKDDALWLLARIYFARVERKKICFDYQANNSRSPHSYTVSPYHLIFKNNNLYLASKPDHYETVSLFIVNKIENLKVLDLQFKEDIPTISDLFKDSLSSFIGTAINVTIQFSEDIYSQIDQVISILDPVIKKNKKDGWLEASFKISDDLYLCKQLFQYGNQVEILKPKALQNKMIKMLRESLSVYDFK
jgi:hypothetical protein